MARSAQRSVSLVPRGRFYTILIRHFECVDGLCESKARAVGAGHGDDRLRALCDRFRRLGGAIEAALGPINTPAPGTG
jgi:hypothetical protein